MRGHEFFWGHKYISDDVDVGSIMDIKKGFAWYCMSFCGVYHKQHLLLWYDKLRRLTTQWPLDIGKCTCKRKIFYRVE